MENVKNVVIDGVEYAPYEPPVETASESVDPIAKSDPFWSFLLSPQFWMIGVAACASVLVREDFASLPWNQIVGQILTLWGSGSASFGLLNKVSKNIATVK